MIEYDISDYYPTHIKSYYVHYVEGLEATAGLRLELLRRVLDEIFPSQDDWGEIFDDDLISELAEEFGDDSNL